MKKKEVEICKTHNEPRNFISDIYGKICIKCYLEITKKKQGPKEKQSIKSFLKCLK